MPIKKRHPCRFEATADSSTPAGATGISCEPSHATPLKFDREFRPENSEWRGFLYTEHYCASAAGAGGAGASSTAGAAAASAAGASAGAALHPDPQLLPHADPQLLPQADPQLDVEQEEPQLLPQEDVVSQQEGFSHLTFTVLHLTGLHLTGLHLTGLQQWPASAELVSSRAARARIIPIVRIRKPLNVQNCGCNAANPPRLPDRKRFHPAWFIGNPIATYIS